MLTRLGSKDDGVVAVVVAVVLSAVFIGFGVLVTDVGALFAERRELQNGADAAALAVAANCASAAGCASGGGFVAVARTKADSNANDGASNVAAAYDAATPAGVCGSGAGMSACASPPTIPSGANYVRVYADTSTPGSAFPNFVTPILAKALVSGYNGSTVRADATVAWGAPGGGRTLPLTFSDCEFSRLVPTGVPADPGAGTAQILYHDGNSGDTCSASKSNADAPGAFGFVNPDSGTCSATIVDGTLATSTGNSVPGGGSGPCSDLLDKDRQTAAYPNHLANTTVLIPIFKQTATTGTGANVVYTIIGMAEFYVTGWSFGGQNYYPTGAARPCSGTTTCIAGYFVRFVDLDATLGSGPATYGAYAVALVG